MPALMKGHTWAEFKHKMTYPCRVEAKVDEIRCHVLVGNDVQFLAYSGKPLANMQEFAQQFRELAAGTGFYEFDCGFQVNGNFNDSYRWVRSTKHLPQDLELADVRFLLYDLPTAEGTFKHRLCNRINVQAVSETVFGLHLQVPTFYICYNEAEVQDAYGMFRKLGHEGAMVKSMDHLYERGSRTYGWLKMKPSADADGVIVGVIEAVCGKSQPELGLRKGDRLGRAGSVLVQCEDGSMAQPHGIPHDLGRDMLSNPDKFIGQWCEFQYMERDRKGGYRHVTFHRLREAKV